MAKLLSLKTDPEKESEGGWVPYQIGVELKIGRIGNTAFAECVRRLSEPHLKELRTNRLPEDVLEDITREAVAKHILMDWKNIEDDDGKPFKYTQKRAEDILADPGMRDLYKFILLSANEAELYRQEIDEESAGN